MAETDITFKKLLKEILDNGVEKTTRSGDVISTFGMSARFNIAKEFPILTLRRVFLRGIITELLWFLSGDTNIKPLVEQRVHIWTQDAYRYYYELLSKYTCNAERKKSILQFTTAILNGEQVIMTKPDGTEFTYTFGDLGPIYGKNWRHFGVNNVDQVADVINKLKTSPNDRRMLITGYNPDDVSEAALPPCHLLYQFYTSPMTEEDKELWKETHEGKNETPSLKLSCSLYCRSQDFLLGTVFNWASASIMTAMIAETVGMGVGDLYWTGGDVHVYKNQLEAAEELLKREPISCTPRLKIANRGQGIDEYEVSDITVENYEALPPIKIELSVG